VNRASLGPARYTPHVMRHTAITRLVEEGVPLPTIQKISGHKTHAMVLRYTHVSGAHVADAMTKLERTVPEPVAADENNTGTTITQELHRAG
jgi:integrase